MVHSQAWQEKPRKTVLLPLDKMINWAGTRKVHQPGIEPGSHRWQQRLPSIWGRADAKQIGAGEPESLDPGARILDPGSWNQDPGTQNPRPRILDMVFVDFGHTALPQVGAQETERHHNIKGRRLVGGQMPMRHQAPKSTKTRPRILSLGFWDPGSWFRILGEASWLQDPRIQAPRRPFVTHPPRPKSREGAARA